ncbi:MAG TPA: DNA mismatch repair protein MutS [Phycisphaerae bacterium]|nr:DNA mismatch repair protein MutS [Phycisphaerae bacterium]
MTHEKPSTSTASPATEKLTPAMRQYMEQKAAAPDALLLFRMGDFYETFFEDAVTTARVLGITLTRRGTDSNGEPIPLAGIPYHALESYLTKLVHAGYKVAISEQVEDPRTAKGVVRREIVRIVTPGTLTEDALLDRGADNYLACLARQGSQVGLAFVELSTGAFEVELISEREVADELARMNPAEILVPEVRIDVADPFADLLAQLRGSSLDTASPTITRRPAHQFDPYQAEQRLLAHFGVTTLEGFGFAGMDPSLCAAAVILDYLGETQKSSLAHILTLHRRQPREFVAIDESTWRCLEVERTIRTGAVGGSLLAAVNRTRTAMGARCLRRWLAAPLRDADRIRERQAAVAEMLADVHLLAEIRTKLRDLADIERITARLGLGRASPRDLVALGVTLIVVEQIVELLDELARRAAPVIAAAEPGPAASSGSGACSATGSRPEGLSVFLTMRRDAMCGLHDLAEYLVTSLSPEAPPVTNEGGIIAPGFDAELDRLRGITADGRQWLADYQAREIQRSGIPSLKVGFNQVFGYYIEIPTPTAAASRPTTCANRRSRMPSATSPMS